MEYGQKRSEQKENSFWNEQIDWKEGRLREMARRQGQTCI